MDRAREYASKYGFDADDPKLMEVPVRPQPVPLYQELSEEKAIQQSQMLAPILDEACAVLTAPGQVAVLEPPAEVPAYMNGPPAREKLPPGVYYAKVIKSYPNALMKMIQFEDTGDKAHLLVTMRLSDKCLGRVYPVQEAEGTMYKGSFYKIWRRE